MLFMLPQLLVCMQRAFQSHSEPENKKLSIANKFQIIFMAFGSDVSGRSVLSVKDTIYDCCYAKALIMAPIKGLFTNFPLFVVVFCFVCRHLNDWLSRFSATFLRGRYRSYAKTPSDVLHTHSKLSHRWNEDEFIQIYSHAEQTLDWLLNRAGRREQRITLLPTLASVHSENI